VFQTPGQLERSRFFLTAHSRMPEINMYGYPRVAIWPIADEAAVRPGAASLSAQELRTGYDNLIAFCSTLGRGVNNSYFFRRIDHRSPTTDINIVRNQALLGMLERMMTRTMPGGASFAQKYDQGDSTQILVQIFDYIRSTNLYDGFLAPTREQILGDGTQAAGDPMFRWETYWNDRNASRTSGKPTGIGGNAHAAFYDSQPKDYRTYTSSRLSRWHSYADNSVRERSMDYVFPGHGMVVPSHYGEQFRGLGRFPCVTEVGFQFLCSADGDPDPGSFRMARQGDGGLTKPEWPGFQIALAELQANTNNRDFQGGRTAPMMDPLPAQALGVGTANIRRGGRAPTFLPGERRVW
jgi:hypothetical protein